MSSSRSVSNLKKKRAYLLIWTGICYIGAAIVLFILIFGQVIKEEVRYDLRTLRSTNVPVASVTPISSQFGIVIPKIGANAPIVANVDPFNEKEYQVALSKGIAHARGSSLPEHTNTGSVFLFAHSAANFYEANRYNAIFYLLNKLQNGDSIYVYYQEKKYVYKVTETKIVDESQVQYLSNTSAGEQLILMTCWPAGTSLQRLLVFAKAS